MEAVVTGRPGDYSCHTLVAVRFWKKLEHFSTNRISVSPTRAHKPAGVLVISLSHRIKLQYDGETHQCCFKVLQARSIKSICLQIWTKVGLGLWHRCFVHALMKPELGFFCTCPIFVSLIPSMSL